MATHCIFLAWEILWTEEPGRIESTGSQRVRYNWATEHSTAEAMVSLGEMTRARLSESSVQCPKNLEVFFSG